MTFGINGAELIILILLAVLVLGPEKLPEYTRKLTEWIRNLRRMAEGAKSQFKDETGTDFDEIDWKKYDPRQYDPRRIIRDALAEPVDGDTQGAAAASVSGSSSPRSSSPSASATRGGLRGDLEAARSQRDALREDLKDLDPRSLLFGASPRRPRGQAGTAADDGAQAPEAANDEPTTAAPATAEAATTEPAPFDADAT
ncbi:Sec-independent protein translocase TatB [Cellulosimicrobium funkei]|nr:Sec-independent protein translocase TatB [Cellulosimicrobium funkei]